jgi:replicative DNA helicase
MNLNELTEYLPPHNLESEQAVLALIIKSSALLDDSNLDDSDFYRNDHKQIFGAIRHCIEKSGDVDVLSTWKARTNLNRLAGWRTWWRLFNPAQAPRIFNITFKISPANRRSATWSPPQTR